MRVPELALEQVRVPEPEPELALALEQVRARELAPVRAQEQVRALEQVRAREPVRAQERVRVRHGAPMQGPERAAVITRRHGSCAIDRGRSTSRLTMPGPRVSLQGGRQSLSTGIRSSSGRPMTGTALTILDATLRSAAHPVAVVRRSVAAVNHGGTRVRRRGQRRNNIRALAESARQSD